MYGRVILCMAIKYQFQGDIYCFRFLKKSSDEFWTPWNVNQILNMSINFIIFLHLVFSSYSLWPFQPKSTSDNQFNVGYDALPFLSMLPLTSSLLFPMIFCYLKKSWRRVCNDTISLFSRRLPNWGFVSRVDCSRITVANSSKVVVFNFIFC